MSCIIIPNPNTGELSPFVLAGDPVNKTGWYEGDGWPNGPVPNDRRYMLSCGPFTMAPGDTQEVVIAIFMARGSDNIQSVAELKKTAESIHLFYGNEILVDVDNENNLTPTQFSLSQNYPNPFNPSTTIKYTVPSSSVISNPLAGKRSPQTNYSEIPNHTSTSSMSVRDDKYNVETHGHASVQLVVYDILGRKVATLINQKQKPGSYEVEFNADKFASGIYFYQLKTADFVQVKKMIYLK